ncbi:hypothetical protein [Calycomorphotria hydatis]|uniref:hypothetical protein n=1 Tax=Calycomorphotria hydatis TaxID=2528027 RepID=UPI0018D22168|nr:hypothetical protein [Calycomorphotria hydatis]
MPLNIAGNSTGTETHGLRDEDRSSQLLREAETLLQRLLPTDSLETTQANIEKVQQLIDSAKEDESCGPKAHALAFRLQLRTLLELGVRGDQASISDLYHTAEQAYQREPNNEEAVIAATTVVHLSAELSKRTGSHQQNWLREYVRQASIFAELFPSETGLASSQLLTAAQTAERFDHRELAKFGYQKLIDNLPNEQETRWAVGATRRLKLTGKPVQISGVLKNGQIVSTREAVGSWAVVLFWRDVDEPQEMVTQLLHQLSKIDESGQIQAFGVRFSEDVSAATVTSASPTFPVIEQQDLSKPFTKSQPESHGNLQEHYGLHEFPTVWLIDPAGKVVSTKFPPNKLQ